jgi:hypothetical protein
MLGYAIEVRKVAKLFSQRNGLMGAGEHLERKCSFDLQSSGPPPPE